MIYLSEDTWFAVRCVFKMEIERDQVYEERLTLWLAPDDAKAIEHAEDEAQQYASALNAEYLGLAQAYRLGENRLGHGSEIFSMMRSSALPPDKYLDRFFDTGSERQERT